MIDRRDAGALKNREAETGEEAIIAGLWKYHRLLPPIQNDPQRQRFHRMLILALYYSFIWIPMRITFFRDMPRDQPAWMAIDTVDVVIDVCFLIDVGLSFRTAFYDEDQNIITDWRVIVRQYLEFWFWIEAFSALQWDIIFGIIELRAVRLLRCLRLLKGKSKVTTQTVRLLRTVAFIGFLCHWVACIWWGLGASWINLNSSFGHSWIFRHSDWSDGEVCDPLPNSTAYKARAEAALQNLTDLVKDPPLTSHQLEVLRWNWQYAWCETPDGQLQHDFKLYLGSVDNLPTGLYRNIDASLIAQQYLSSMYWSLTMLMKTPYVGPDTAPEKIVASIGVLLGAFLFAVIMASVVSVIKAIEAHDAARRNLLGSLKLFAESRQVPYHLERDLRKFHDMQWTNTAGLDANEFLRNTIKLPSRFHDEGSLGQG